jgi:hypothetical protein
MALPAHLHYLDPLLDVLVEMVVEEVRAGNSQTPRKEHAVKACQGPRRESTHRNEESCGANFTSKLRD